jgi:hypothetical protein
MDSGSCVIDDLLRMRHIGVQSGIGMPGGRSVGNCNIERGIDGIFRRRGGFLGISRPILWRSWQSLGRRSG